jgi:predicted TIM-barrel fold metal-dependent hydrolase
MFATAADHHIVLSFLMAPEDLPELDRMCARFPETPVVVDHLCLIGRAGSFVPEEIEALCRLSRNRRIMIKIGGFYALGARTPPYLDLLPLIRRVVSVFGAERCMWESDSPKQVQAPHSYQAALALIRDHAEFLSEEDKRQLLEKTAETLFFAG